MNFKILSNESNLLKALGVSLVVHLLLVWWFYSINDQSQLSQKEPNIKEKVNINIVEQTMFENKSKAKANQIQKSKKPQLHKKTPKALQQRKEVITKMKPSVRPIQYAKRDSLTSSRLNSNKINQDTDLVKKEINEKSTIIDSKDQLIKKPEPEKSSNEQNKMHDKLTSEKNLNQADSNSDKNLYSRRSISPQKNNKQKSNNSKKSIKNERPKCRNCIKPNYPRKAEKRGREGIVVVKIAIARSGHVTNVQLLKSSGDTSIDRAAINAAKSSTFYPLNSIQTKIIQYEWVL